MTLACRLCQTRFEVRDQDQAFYEKISPVLNGKKHPLPPPGLCPDCRQQRRQAFRNERNLYNRSCDKCRKEIISIYSPDKPFTVYCQTCWWAEAWDATELGLPIDPHKPFWEQYKILQSRVPRIALYVRNNENSDYTNFSEHVKDSYLSFSFGFSENILYSNWLLKDRDCMDCYSLSESELCYECQDARKCYNSRFVINCAGCIDSAFLYDCKNCRNCLFSTGLTNKQYYVSNKPVGKEEFEKQYQRIFDGTLPALTKAREYFRTFLQKVPHRATLMVGAENSVGDVLHYSKNLQYCFNVLDSQDSSYCYDSVALSDCWDTYESVLHCQLLYDTQEALRTQSSRFSSVVYDGYEMNYCDSCYSCKNCFGCIGLRQKEYCILNRQYSKEEYEKLVGQILEGMSQRKEWGEFFPTNLSPFGYNETMAQVFYPLSKEQAREQGFGWSDYESPKPEVKKVITTEQMARLPLDIGKVPDDILDWALTCKVSGKLYRIIKPELQFYRDQRLPIPHKHPDMRHQERMASRNPRKLWTRPCGCSIAAHGHPAEHKEVQTTFAPDRPETIFCEECYLKEVY